MTSELEELDTLHGREFVRGNHRVKFSKTVRKIIWDDETVEYCIHPSVDGTHRKITMVKDGEPIVRFTMVEDYEKEMAKWLFDRNVDYEEEDNELYDADEIEVKLYDAGHETELTEKEIEIVREGME